MTRIYSKFRNYYFGGIISIIAILLTIVFVEGGTRLLNIIHPKPPRTWLEFAKASPLPFKDADIDIDLLNLERSRVVWTSGDDFGVGVKDLKGTYINITNGIRLTTGAPAKAQNRIWIFGGSTMICSEVPDQYTIPSQIQKLINDKKPGFYEVINLGMTSITTKHQLWRLRNLTRGIKKGDLVIFYDGVNDISQSLYYLSPTGNMADANRKVIAASKFAEKVILKIYTKYSLHSAFVDRFLNPFDPTERDVFVPAELTLQLKQTYVDNIIQARQFAIERGADFFHFVQPSLYSVNRTTEWERQMMKNGYLYPLGLKKIYEAGYPVLREANSVLKSKGVKSFDISNALNDRQVEIFFDFVHVNHIGNKMIAQAIADHVWK